MKSKRISRYYHRIRAFQPNAASAIGGDDQSLSIGIQGSALATPTPKDGRHCKRSSIVIGSHIDNPRVAREVKNTIEIRTVNVGLREVVAGYLDVNAG